MADSVDFVKTVMSHYGVLGMSWGKTGAGSSGRSSSGSAKTTKKSADHQTSRDILAKRKVSSMSNADLAVVTKRLQLERSYAQLTANPKAGKRGKKFVTELLSAGKQGQEAYNLYNSPAGKAAQDALKKSMSKKAKKAKKASSGPVDMGNVYNYTSSAASKASAKKTLQITTGR